ncbi:MAG: glycosyltransferase family 2 protein [Isosphaeraceae bacterium]
MSIRQVDIVRAAPGPRRQASPALRAWTGRFTLWSVTLSLASGGLGVVTAALWLLTPLGGMGWFEALFRGVVAAALGSGAVAFAMLFIVHRLIVPPRDAVYQPLDNARVHVGLTAWNDEEAIAPAVRDFKACDRVHKVVVVDNNSKDNTAQAARDAGADAVVIETVPGYGSCCMRALAEAAVGADVVILCEGDMTFSAGDVKKFIAYLENCDLALGTRATQELRDVDTQMDWLLNPGNQIVAKLVQTRFWGTRLTDMGCTYRAIRVEAYERLKGRLTVKGNHFSPHMFIEALQTGMRVIEIPIYFRARVGESKGVGSNKVKATRVALRMLGLVYRA